MDAAARWLVRERAGSRCEYCQFHQEHSRLRHHIEHIIAKQHGGTDGPDNLALACHHCNLYKGPNLAGIDAATGKLALLFNPRLDKWEQHFAFQGPYIIGLTAIGRASVQVLAMNDPGPLKLREKLWQLSEF